jgi:hypothetical protein
MGSSTPTQGAAPGGSTTTTGVAATSSSRRGATQGATKRARQSLSTGYEGKGDQKRGEQSNESQKGP